MVLIQKVWMKWWEKRGSYGPGENCWYFAVDGLDKKFVKYIV